MKTAKQRVIFDENVYFGGEGEEIAVEDLAQRDECDIDEVRERYSDHDIFQHAMEMRAYDYEIEMDDLTAYFDGGSQMMSSFENPLTGNPVLVAGSNHLYDGTRHGTTAYRSFKDALDTSSSRLDKGNVFADCEIQKVWDENGSLFIHGAHHDGAVEVEVRQLTDKGFEALEAIDDAWYGEPFTVNGKTYDGDAAIDEAMSDLWNDPDLAALPRYMEQCFGCPAEEWDEPEKKAAVEGHSHDEQQEEPLDLASAEQSARDASSALADGVVHDGPDRER